MMTDRRQPPALGSKVITTGVSVSLVVGMVAAMASAALASQQDAVSVVSADPLASATVPAAGLPQQTVVVATTAVPPAAVVPTTPVPAVPQVNPIPIAVNVPIPAAAPAPKQSTSNPPKKASSTKASG